MYQIKENPEDFMVWEIPNYELEENGQYAYFWLKKQNYNTIDVIKLLSDKLNIPMKNIGYAGSKDRAAITEQVISIRAIKKERIEGLKLKDIELTYIGQGNNPISLGDLKANRFKITVRNLDKRHTPKNTSKIPNLFGPQRFSKNNVEIGKALITGNFKKAVSLIDQRNVQYYLDDNLGDYAGALRQLPLKLRKMYVHAYQSYLWNKTVEEYLETKPLKSEMIPVVGFQTNLRSSPVNNIIRKLLVTEGITPRDFIVRPIPELSSEGTERELYLVPENLDIRKEPDELNKEKNKAIVTFSLPKGSYATIVIDYLFG